MADITPGTAVADITLEPQTDITPGTAAADITLEPQGRGVTSGTSLEVLGNRAALHYAPKPTRAGGRGLTDEEPGGVPEEQVQDMVLLAQGQSTRRQREAF